MINKKFAEELKATKKWLGKYVLSIGISPLDQAILMKFDSWLTGKEYDIKYDVLCHNCLGRLSLTNTHIDGVLQSAKICNDCKLVIPDIDFPEPEEEDIPDDLLSEDLLGEEDIFYE